MYDKASANPFSALVAPPSDEERFVAYVIREHRLGRPIDEILRDPYLTERLSDARRQHLLEHAAVVGAVAADLVAVRRSVRRR